MLTQKLSAMEGLAEITRQEVNVLKASLGPWYRPDIGATFARPLPPLSSPHMDAGGPLPGEAISLHDLTAYFPPQPLARNPSAISESAEVASPTFPGAPSAYSSMPFHSPRPLSFSASPAAAVQASPVAPLNLSAGLEGSLSGLHDSLAALASSVDSLGRRNDIALMTETLRLNEEVGSIRGVLHGLRMQVRAGQFTVGGVY